MLSRRSFTREFKIETVKMVTGSDTSVNQIAKIWGFIPTRFIDGSSSFQRSLRLLSPGRVIWFQARRKRYGSLSVRMSG